LISFFLFFKTGIIDTKAIISQRCCRVQKDCQRFLFEGRNGQWPGILDSHGWHVYCK